jgi:uncharacterized protein (TIGR02996 family)
MANERQALLAAVCASPHDDALRLTFADWLEKNKQPERAEYIRAEIEMEKLSRDDPGWESLRDRCDELCGSLDRLDRGKARRASPWTGDLPSLKGVMWSTLTERGFFYHPIFESMKAVRDHAAAVLAATPVTWIEVKRMSPAAVQELLALPWLAQVTDLTLSGAVESEGIRALVGCPHLGRLEHLWVEGGRVGDEGVEAIAKAKGLPNLSQLTLKGDRVTLRGVRALCASKSLPRLRRVNGLGSRLQVEAITRNLIDRFNERFPGSWWS